MSDNSAPVMIATVWAPIVVIWIGAIATALIVPRYAVRFGTPWPVLAAMILVLMVLATLATWLVLQATTF